MFHCQSNALCCPRTGKRIGCPGFDPHSGLSLTLDLLCELSADPRCNFGHDLKTKVECTLLSCNGQRCLSRAGGGWPGTVCQKKNCDIVVGGLHWDIFCFSLRMCVELPPPTSQIAYRAGQSRVPCLCSHFVTHFPLSTKHHGQGWHWTSSFGSYLVGGEICRPHALVQRQSGTVHCLLDGRRVLGGLW